MHHSAYSKYLMNQRRQLNQWAAPADHARSFTYA